MTFEDKQHAFQRLQACNPANSRRAPPRPAPRRPRPRRTDRRVLGTPGDAHSRRVADRPGGGQGGASGGVRAPGRSGAEVATQRCFSDWVGRDEGKAPLLALPSRARRL
jgi:hypothetical protein